MYAKLVYMHLISTVLLQILCILFNKRKKKSNHHAADALYFCSLTVCATSYNIICILFYSILWLWHEMRNSLIARWVTHCDGTDFSDCAVSNLFLFFKKKSISRSANQGNLQQLTEQNHVIVYILCSCLVIFFQGLTAGMRGR